MTTKPTPTEYFADTVIPALKLAGYQLGITPPGTRGTRTAFIQVLNGGREESVRIYVDDSGYKNYISLVRYDRYNARPSRYEIDRYTGTANLPGILTAAKRLSDEVKASLAATIAYDERRTREKAIRADNLPLLRTLAEQFGATLEENRYDEDEFLVRVRRLTVYASDKPGMLRLAAESHTIGTGTLAQVGAVLAAVTATLEG